VLLKRRLKLSQNNIYGSASLWAGAFCLRNKNDTNRPMGKAQKTALVHNFDFRCKSTVVWCITFNLGSKVPRFDA
jgi:hypothetical protein